MARYVKVGVVAPRPLDLNPQQDMNACVDEMIAFWDSWLEHVLCDRPDLVVLPEVCDRPGNFSKDQQKAFYMARGDRIRDHFCAVAKTQNCNIAYSADRIMPDGTWRNSIQIINRQGGLDGVYNKNHVTLGEFYDYNILYGKEAPVIKTDVGTVGGVICFDLNFQELREKYMRNRPEMLVFTSVYHGGLMQNYWAYACKAYFIGCVSNDQCTVISPTGDLIAQSTNYYPFVTADINLDYRIVHIDYNREKFPALKQKYGSRVKIHDPGHLGCVLISSECDDLSIDEVIADFGLELWDDYYARALADRHTAGHIEP